MTGKFEWDKLLYSELETLKVHGQDMKWTVNVTFKMDYAEVMTIYSWTTDNDVSN